MKRFTAAEAVRLLLRGVGLPPGAVIECRTKEEEKAVLDAAREAA